MLNPFAHDFKPIPFPSPPEPTIIDKPKRKVAPKKAEPKKAEVKKEPKKAEPKEAKKAEPKEAKTAEVKKEPKKEEPKEAKKKKSAKKTGVNLETTNGNKKKDSQANSKKGGQTSSAATVLLESPFIAIEAAIDPIHRIDKSTRQEKMFEHGYERYIDWIDRSLNCYDTVTLVGMENAIVDIVSLVTILQDRKIAAHDDVETFTMNPGNGKLTSCIQVKLHSFF